MQGIFMPGAEHCPAERNHGDTNSRRSMILGLNPKFWIWLIGIIGFFLCVFWMLTPDSFAQASLPGTDASDKLEAAGTLLRILDTALFKWGARIFAGICIMSAAWSLKEQRFGIAIICIVGALVFGTAPTWVQNIFSIGTGDSIFGN